MAGLQPRRTDPLTLLTEAIAKQEAKPMDNAAFDQAVNGPQGYPQFNKMLKFNDQGWDAFMNNGPMSENIDDRRSETVDDFISRTLEAQAR